MRGVRKKSGNLLLIVILTIFLPVSVYIIYSNAALRENEEALLSIYQKQLESILFSVNQYSTDYVNSILNKTESEITIEGRQLQIGTEGLYTTRHKFVAFMLTTPDSKEFEPLYVNHAGQKILVDKIKDFAEQNEDIIRTLSSYIKTGYRKIEPAGLVEADGIYQVMMAMLKVDNREVLFTGLIEPSEFAEEILRPKMQEIADEQMIITLKRKGQDEIIYSTDSVSRALLVSTDMWLFPELTVGIMPRGETLQKVVKDRLNYNLAAVGLVAALLVIGIFLLIRNVNREMRLAQNKTDFVSNVSHELRTPLALISMFAETLMLDRVPTDERKREYYEIIYKETHRLTNIVNRILNFSKIEAQKRTYDTALIDMNELVKEVISDYSYHLQQKGFESQIKSTEEEILIHADRDAIYEAVVILLDNAVKYSEEKREITIHTGQNAKKAWIEVIDKGVGIPTDKIEDIFDKFFRVDQSEVYTVQGAGLGLTILKHIMAAHNGDIEVNSTVGRGSSFKLVFPKK